MPTCTGSATSSSERSTLAVAAHAEWQSGMRLARRAPGDRQNDGERRATAIGGKVPEHVTRTS